MSTAPRRAPAPARARSLARWRRSRVLPAGVHRPDGDLDRGLRAGLHGRRAAWNMFSGYSGYLALGHAVFFGGGGYAWRWPRGLAVTGGWPVFALLPFGGLVAGLIAIPVGLIALRTRRHTFVVVTIAIFFIFQLAAYNLASPAAPPASCCRSAVLGRQLQPALLLRGAGDPGRSPSPCPGRYGARASGCSCSRSATTRTARGPRGARRGGSSSPRSCSRRSRSGMVGGLYFVLPGQIYPQFAFDPLFDMSIALMAFLGGLGTSPARCSARWSSSRCSSTSPRRLQQRHLPDRLRRPVPGRDPVLPRGVVPASRSSERRRAGRAQRTPTSRATPGPTPAASRGRRDERPARGRGRLKAFGGVQALCGCATSRSRREINGLIGPNGSGKTTLFNVITGYERVQQGKVRFTAPAITNAPPDRVFGLGIGRTFQLTRIFAG